MGKEVYIVFGGRLPDTTSDFTSLTAFHFVGFYRDGKEAKTAWQAASQRHVDDALARYFILPLHEFNRT